MDEKIETTETSTELAVAESAVKVADVAPYAADYFLRSMVDLINKTELSFDVTLNVDGFLISGHLASGKAYFEGIATEMGEAFERSVNAESGEIIRKYFSDFGIIYENVKDDENQLLPVYIHLRDAKFFHNSGPAIPKNRGIWWRGRISSVSGFTMGSLGTSE